MSSFAEQPWKVGGEKQLFIDHRFIESSEDITLMVNPPVKQTVEAFQHDKPWEAFNRGWYSVAQDGDVFKMWYAACDGDQWAGGRWRLCYAVSRDGLSWEKPDLGLVDYEGSKNNNILMDDEKLTNVFIDPHGVPEQRYKIIFGFPGETRVGTSPDGIHWDLPSEPVSHLPPGWDTAKQGWWDERIEKYVAYVRVQIDEENVLSYPFVAPIESDPPVVAPTTFRPIRAVGRMEMDDITGPWPDDQIQTVLVADELDPPGSDIYHAGVYPYPYAADAYFMFPFTYHHFREGETTVKNDGINDSQFCASRDGIHWMRYDRRSYIPRGLPGENDHGLTHGAPYHFRQGNYLYQYYGGTPWTHGGYRRYSEAERRDPANWGRRLSSVAVQRLDGFVSADAPYTGGRLVTPPIVFQGDRLELNIDVAAMGEARVEIQHEDGKPAPGFALQDCDRVLFNDVASSVAWRGRAEVSALAGRPVRLNIEMRSAKLYAFQFV